MPFRVSEISKNGIKYKERSRIRTMNRNNKKLPLQSIYSLIPGRTSVSASKKGSITVEAAMAVPVFFLAVVSLLYLMEIMAVRTSVRAGLQYAGKQVAVEAYATRTILPSGIEDDVVSAIGAERLERSIVVGGSKGIRCSESKMWPGTGVGELVAVYQVKLPVPMFAIRPVEYRETMKIKAWTGYEKTGFGAEDEEIVYITETGLVYHKDYHCTHLELSIRAVVSSEIETLRNESGGKYYPCEQCAKSDSRCVYITETGNRYHSSLACSGLKRTIYAVPLSEAVGKGACSRCGR